MPNTRSKTRALAPDSPHWLLDVPDNVLQNILKHLDLQQRLAPVSRHWLQVARPTTIHVAGLNSNRLESLSNYLATYGNEVSSMRLEAEWDHHDFERMLQLDDETLPCMGNLRDLELYNFQLRRRPEEIDAGVLSAATGLTRLVIDTAVFTPSYMHTYSWRDAGQPRQTEAELAAAVAAAKAEAAASFENIQQLTSLQELQLVRMYTEVQLPQEDDSGVYTILYDPLNIPGEGLAALTQLTKLSLTAAAANPRNTLQHISRLQRLQDLQLSFLPATGPEDEPPQLDDPAAADTFAGLGALQHLTSLSVSRVPGRLARKYLQGGQRQSSILTALQRLQLDEVMFEPTLLAGMTQLTCLELSDMSWVLESQDFPPGPGAGQPTPVHGLGAYKVLLLLPHLKQLRRLRLDIKTWPEAEYQLPAYSALTANTNLEHLDLQHYEYSLPTTAWKHIFRKELQLPGIAGVMFQGIAPRTSEDRVLHCCPVVAAGMMEGRLREGILELRCLDEDEGVSHEELRLLEVNADDPPGVPAVLGALTHLEVVFSGAYHGWGVHGCSEAEFQEGNFGMQQKRGGTIW